MNASNAHLVKLSSSVCVPADQILLIVDYGNTFAARQVRDGKKKGIVWNFATVDKSDTASGPKKRTKRPAVKCVLFLKNGMIATTATSYSTIMKRYEDSLKGDNQDE